MIARLARRLETTSLAVPMALLLGGALAFALFAMPGRWLAHAIGASGLPGLIPDLAPPLGRKVRGLIALAGGMAGAVPVWMLFRWLERPTMPLADPMAMEAAPPVIAFRDPPADLETEPQASAPLAVLEAMPLPVPASAPMPISEGSDRPPEPSAAIDAPSVKAPGDVADAQPGRVPWLRWLPGGLFGKPAGHGEEAGDPGAPTLRRADAHPDAPPRRPIFAATDLGAPFDTAGAQWGDPVAETTAEPLLLDAAWQTRGVRAGEGAAEPTFAPAEAAASAAALMARLDAALARRPRRPASPPVQGERLRDAMVELRNAGLG